MFGPAATTWTNVQQGKLKLTDAAVGQGEAQGDGIFELSRTATGVRAEKVLPSGLNVVKDFVLGTNYLLAATVRLENHDTKALSLPAWV